MASDGEDHGDVDPRRKWSPANLSSCTCTCAFEDAAGRWGSSLAAIRVRGANMGWPPTLRRWVSIPDVYKDDDPGDNQVVANTEWLGTVRMKKEWLIAKRTNVHYRRLLGGDPLHTTLSVDITNLSAMSFNPRRLGGEWWPRRQSSRCQHGVIKHGVDEVRAAHSQENNRASSPVLGDDPQWLLPSPPAHNIISRYHQPLGDEFQSPTTRRMMTPETIESLPTRSD